MGDWRSGYNSDGNSSGGDGGGRWGGDYGWGGKDDRSTPSSDGRGRYYRKSSSSSSSNKDAYATYTKDDGVSLKNEDGGGWGFDDDERSDKDDLKSNSSDGKTFDILKHSLEWNDGEQEFKDEEANFSVDSDLNADTFRTRRKSSSSEGGRRSRKSRRSTSSSEREDYKKKEDVWRKSRSQQYYPDVDRISSEKVSWCCCTLM